MTTRTEKNGYKIIKKNENIEEDFILDYRYKCTITDIEAFKDFIKDNLKKQNNMSIVPRLKSDDKQILSLDFDFHPKKQYKEAREELLNKVDRITFVKNVDKIIKDMYEDLECVCERNTGNDNYHLYYPHIFLSATEITQVRNIVIKKMEEQYEYFDNDKADVIDLLNEGKTLIRLPFMNKIEKGTFIADTMYVPFNLKSKKDMKMTLTKSITHIENVFCNSFNANFEEYGDIKYEMNEEYVEFLKTIQKNKEEEDINKYNQSVVDIDTTKDKIEQLLNGFDKDYFAKNETWNKLIIILTNEKYELDFINKFLRSNITDYRDSYDSENERRYNKIKNSKMDRKMTIKTLYGMLKEHNPRYFVELIKLNIGEMKEFSQEYFNYIPVIGDDNYELKKKYFEEHYKYFKDIDTFMRVKYTYNKRMDYYNKDLVDIRTSGLKTDLYQVRDDSGDIKNEKFIDRYLMDLNKQHYFNVEFNPSATNTNYYNLFDGFHYDGLCKDDEITEEDKEEFELLLNFLKEYACEGDDNIFNYFISFFAQIIQQPDFLTHIIPIFYSKEHGTGKSSVLKFFMKVIGRQYAYCGTIADITNTHTTAHVGKFINVLEEPIFTDAFVEDIKRMSQQEQANYNGKNKLEVQVNTFVRYTIAENHAKNIKIPKEDRRFVVFNFKKCDEEELVDRIDSLYSNKKIVYLMGKYLESFKLHFNSRREWMKGRPLTDSYYNMVVKDNLSSFIEAIKDNDDCFDDILIGDYDLFHFKKGSIIDIPADWLYNFYKEYCDYIKGNALGLNNFKKGIKAMFLDLYSSRKAMNGRKLTCFKFNLDSYSS